MHYQHTPIATRISHVLSGAEFCQTQSSAIGEVLADTMSTKVNRLPYGVIRVLNGLPAQREPVEVAAIWFHAEQDIMWCRICGPFRSVSKA
jgi:hypothetical protein